MTSKKLQNISDLLDFSLAALKKAGADHASVSYKLSESRGVKVRDGQVEGLTANNATKLGMKGWVGNKHNATALSFDATAIATTHFDPAEIEEAAKQIVKDAGRTTANDFCQPPEAKRLSRIRQNNRLDLNDSTPFDENHTVEQARIAEAAAMSMPKIAISRGASGSWARTLVATRSSFGFESRTLETSHGLGVTVIARHDGDEQSDAEGYGTAHLADMKDPAEIGRRAAEKAANALNPKQAKQGAYPVIFSPDVGAALLQSFAAAAGAKAIRLGQSFLANAQGKQVCPSGLTILNNPHLKRGHNSAMFTGEGLPTQKITLVENGVFQAMLLNMEEARRAKIEDSAIIQSDFNMTIEPSVKSVAALFAEAGEGLYVTGLQGHGTDTASGDYSHGANGFWFENGVITHAVSGATIAGNLSDMFAGMEVADNLDRYESNLATPTIRVAHMRVS